MAKNIINHVDTYNDHSKSLTINASSVDIPNILRAFMAEDVEDITPVEMSDKLFCRITNHAYDKGKAQQVENELRSACISAPKLVKTIRTNEALGYLDTQNLKSSDLFDMLNEHFHLPFKLRTFQDSRSK